MDWNEIVLPSTALVGLIARGSIVYLALVVLIRVVGQRESGGLGLTDILVVVLVAEAAGAGLVGDANTIADGLVVVITMLFWSVVLDAVAYRWPRFAGLIKARPRPLISDGQFNRRLMRREFITEDEVLSRPRLHGISHPTVVARAYLEPNGMISIIPREGVDVSDPPERPVS